MGATVTVEKRTVIHKKSGGISLAFPDVCKTPAPPSPPVPVPYPNIAKSSDADKTTKKVKIDGKKVCVKSSTFSRSSGDEAGTLKGMVSSVNMGKAEFIIGSFLVKFEGKAVVRLGDPMTQNGGGPNAAGPAETQAPVPPAMGAGGDAEACERLKAKEVPDSKIDDVAESCGMAREHAEGIRETCAATGDTVSFRSTNTDCMDKIRAGFPAKGCDVTSKTISEKTLAKASNAGEIPSDLRGFVGSYDEAGNITGVLGSDGATIPLSEIPPAPASTLTGDYDMHDMFSSGGSRIPPGDAESSVISKLNEAIGRGPSDAATDMVRHGPQANYPDFMDLKGEPGKPGLMVPDVSSKDPLLVFDGNGKVYKLEDEKELRDLYACKGEKVPQSWDWSAEDWETAAQEGRIDTQDMSAEDFAAFATQREEVLGALGI